MAKKSNQIIVKNIVKAIKGANNKCHFIHISTDQVYRGTTNSKNYRRTGQVQGTIDKRKRQVTYM